MIDLPSDDKARQFVDGLRDCIVDDEMPVILHHLLGLVKFAQGHNQQIQIEAHGQEALLIEIVGVTYRLLNLVGQLIGSEKLLELLRQYHEKEEPS